MATVRFDGSVRDYSPVAADETNGAGAESGAGGSSPPVADGDEPAGARLLLVASNCPDKETLMRAGQPSVTVVEYDFDEQLDLEKLALASTWLAGDEKFKSVGSVPDSSPHTSSAVSCCLTCRRGAASSCTAPPARCASPGR